MARAVIFFDNAVSFSNKSVTFAGWVVENGRNRRSRRGADGLSRLKQGKGWIFSGMTMAKYNINLNGSKEAAYRSMVSQKLMHELKGKIVTILLKKKKYKDKEYSAKRLADDLGTNTRYVSAVVSVCFGMNYTSLVNKYRIDNAKSLLKDKRYKNLKMEEVSDMVGFSNRQSFYAAFYKFTGITPRQYKLGED